MQRILEPEFMDTPDESQAYDAMDHAAANDSFVDAFLAAGGASCRRVLDLGTGPGDIPILLVQRTAPTLEVVAIDAAATMLELAETKRRALADELASRIEFRQADAKGLPFEDGSFDGVVSNTILHHIPEPLGFLREAGRVLSTQGTGTLVIRDLFRPATEADAWALVDLHAAGADEAQRKLFYDSFHAALTLDEARATAEAAGLTGASVEMSSDRHYTIVWQPGR